MNQVNCAMCQNTVSEQDLVISEHGKICTMCELDLDAPKGGLPGMLGGAAAVAVFPFFASVKSTKSNSVSIEVDGQTINSGNVVSHDYVALGGGILAMAMAVAALFVYAKQKEMKWVAGSAICLVLGIFHVVVRSGFIL